jgi:sugar O-acyltransferase (sialic acid O-acetyltransferase NeuD family)
MDQNKIAVFGAGGFGREVQMLIEQINAANEKWRFIGFFDDGVEMNTIVNEYSVLGGIAELNEWSEHLAVVFAVGNPITKKTIVERIKNKILYYPVLIHPNVMMGDIKYNKIGEGCIITAGNILTVNFKIGKHVILNLACTVGHDSVIGDFSSFMPSVNISGEVNIGECVYVGTGAKIINQLEIGNNTIVGAGALVAKSLPANCTAVGIPAKPIKFHK